MFRPSDRTAFLMLEWRETSQRIVVVPRTDMIANHARRLGCI